jgi:hypothetical protein
VVEGNIEGWELVAVIAGGSTLGAVLVGLVSGMRTWQRERSLRKGRARLIHEDLYRLQSTLTRLFYETCPSSKLGDNRTNPWLLRELADHNAHLDVIAHLRHTKLKALSSALGWDAYLRSSWKHNGPVPKKPEIIKIYKACAAGRWAVERKAKLGRPRIRGYREHVPSNLLGVGDTSEVNELPTVSRRWAKRLASDLEAKPK